MAEEKESALKSAFDGYDYVAVIIPGAIMVFGSTVIFPGLRTYVALSDTTAGDFGMFVVLSFVAGHLVQAVADVVVEPLFWHIFGPMPTQSVLSKQSLLSNDQRAKLFEKVKARYQSFDDANETPANWFNLTREIYGLTADAKKTDRVDKFLRVYGLLLGTATALMILTFTTAAVTRPVSVPALLVFLALAFLAFFRMYRFGVHYARELFVRYLSV